jgi:excinuclease ABC subunit C
MNAGPDLENIIKSLPHSAGVYRFYDKTGTVIYVGKAKDLRKRVSSYFTKNPENGKLRMLIKKIAGIDTIITETEQDALLLENNLIKKYRPRYNVLLKDDKTFPWICIKKEAFPRVFSTRHIKNDGSEYFGPYASVKMMKTLLNTIQQLYPLRTCSLNLSPKNIEKGKYKVCLEYHIGNCKAPCTGKQSEEEYNGMINQIRSIIKGSLTDVINNLKNEMYQYAGKMEFEKAQLVKEKLDILENYKSKSTIVNPRISNVDVFSLIDDTKTAYVNYLKVMNGAVVQAHTVEIKKRLNETPQELLSFAIVNLRNRFESKAEEIIVPFDPQITLEKVKITVPKQGDKKHLLQLSERNAKYYRLEQLKQQEILNPEKYKQRVLETLKKDLRMNEIPLQIECFDNSNFQGEYPVASMVQFYNTKPNKKEYRHFNIKTVEGPNDFASMEEIIYRRYSRLIEEKKPLPQLIVVDGGKGQLSSAVKSLKKLGLYGKITIIGIAKKLEEIYFPGDPLPLYLDKKSESLRLIQRLRDEAHRFGITHHRNKRVKGTIKSELTSIPGIGPDTAKKLLRKFKSLKKIKSATKEQLSETVGKAKAAILIKYFESQNLHRSK